MTNNPDEIARLHAFTLQVSQHLYLAVEVLTNLAERRQPKPQPEQPNTMPTFTRPRPKRPRGYRILAEQVEIERGDLIWTPANGWRNAKPSEFGYAASNYRYVARPCAGAVKAVVA